MSSVFVDQVYITCADTRKYVHTHCSYVYCCSDININIKVQINTLYLPFLHDTLFHIHGRYEQKAVFAVIIPRMDYLKECLSSQGIPVMIDDSMLCAHNEAIKLVSITLLLYGYDTA